MSMLRTGFFALREARPTTSVFRRKVDHVLDGKAKAEAEELVRLAGALLAPGKKNLFEQWCIADADFSLMLMRLVANEDALPAHVAEYAVAQWQRPSVRKFLSYIPTMK
jgi:glutathione S-transferase